MNDLLQLAYLVFNYRDIWASLVAQLVKSLPAMQQASVWALAQEYALEKEMATHPSILA